MGHVLEHVVGPWGAMAINIGLVASLVGTLIGWFLLVSEISHVAGKRWRVSEGLYENQ